ncbi:hypothetical protein DFR52_106257 [Hoeflea marina]|uniref:Uncharacterized protein n=1 Tax=Hoeflea marina TaxID=274592 RepID=A0A317PFN4_9HYPH|nr:hypothetical protein [Hoeflea marina]PWV97732.1 hypothetical protein DFR52_106257 [Hoeflea marina]
MSAALSRTSPISREMGLAAELVSQHITSDGLVLSTAKAEVLLRRLNLIKRRIANLEHELGAYRAAENGQAAAAILGDLCMEVLQEGVLEAAKESPVVYPDFSRGKRS